MKDDKGNWFPSETEPNNQISPKAITRHHLFTKSEIQYKLIQIFGFPNTLEEREFLKQEVKKCHNQMPLYRVTWEHHQKIHENDLI